MLEAVRDARWPALGPNHPQTLATLNNLAAAYLARRPDEPRPSSCSNRCATRNWRPTRAGPPATPSAR